MTNFRVALIGVYPPPFGGVSVTIMELANQLFNDKIPFRLFTPMVPRRVAPDYLCYYDNHVFNISENLFFRVRKFKPDVIHIQESTLNWRIGLLSKLMGIPVIHHVHGERFPDMFLRMPPMSRLLLKTFAKTAEGIIAVSHDLAKFIESLGVDHHRIHVIPSLLPFENTAFSASDKLAAGGELLTLVTTGYKPFTYPHYGFNLVPSVAKRLKEKNIRFKWYLVGQASRQQAETFRNTLSENGLQNQVEFIGELERPQLLGLLESAHLFVRTKYSDSYGLVIAEAHQLGCHCLFGDNNPHFNDGDRLVKYRTGDADDLTAKLLELIPMVSLDKSETQASPFTVEALENYKSIKRVYKAVTGKC